MNQFLIGLAIGVVLAIVILISMSVRSHKSELEHKADINKMKTMITDRMDIESETITKLKDELEDIKKKNEDLRISLTTISQKPGRKEISRLHIYQAASENMMLTAPGFGPAWQAALKESVGEFEKTYTSLHPFVRRIIPTRFTEQITDDGNKEN
jgi:MFS superfamily sulfate permease-like transporter